MSNEAQKNNELMVKFDIDGNEIKLTPSIVQEYIVGTDAKITNQEFKLFTELCKVRKLSSDSQSGIESTPFYSWWDSTDRRADSAVTPVAHKISPDHRF